ncbi:MAG: pitrilysin family protein [Vicinamibacterales bacterium]|nr:pitrilysin family protein [Vicinamibacterales bacterium]
MRHFPTRRLLSWLVRAAGVAVASGTFLVASGLPLDATVRLEAAVQAPAAAAPAPSTAAAPPPFQYERVQLPNGLTVIYHQDHSTPIAHVQLWYHVGSKDERPGRTGFAHLFEHMMFKGSRNVEPEQHTSMISSVGGRANAYTNEDATVYWQTVPSHFLPMVLWMEADRMATLRVDERTFINEREVVKEERRMRIENQPYGRLNEIIYANAFTTHPYRHPVIGSMADLESATIDDVREFHRTYYVPANATMVVAGDFDMAETQQMVTRYFGRIPKAEREVPRDIPREPPQTREKRVVVEEAWPLPAVVVAHHITYDGHPDAYPLHIVSKVLSDGQSSRIFRRLVYDTGLALTAFGGANIIEHPNLFYAVALVNPGQSVAEVERALIAELDKLKTDGITERELQRAKNQFARDYIIGRESLQQKATHLAHAEVLHADITTADGEFHIFQNITREDVQRVANTYFKPETRLVLHVLPRGSGQ